MKYVLSVSLLAFALNQATVPQTLAQAPALQKGISVQMAATSNATAMPDADQATAWIIAVTADGSTYLGTDLVSHDHLADKMIRTPRYRDQNLYIKADARAPYADVEYVLKAAHTAEFESPVLLTSQSPSPNSGIVSPKGLLVLLASPAGMASTTVQVFPSKQQPPTVKVNDALVPWSALQSKLSQVLQNKNDKAVLVEADGQLPFEQVAHVIDVCSAAGFRVVLVPSGL